MPRPIGIQLYGADATIMARAAEMVTAVVKPDFIDINFGCPVKKVVKNNGGSGCLKDLGLVQQIIRAVRPVRGLPKIVVRCRPRFDYGKVEPEAIPLSQEILYRGGGSLARRRHPHSAARQRAAWRSNSSCSL